MNLSVTKQRPFVCGIRKNKTKRKPNSKNTHRYLQQLRSLFSRPSHLRVTFCRTVHTRSTETKALCYSTRPFGRGGWHEFSVRVEVVLPRLSLGSCCTSVNELKQHLLRHWILDAVADSWEQRIHSHVTKLVCCSRHFNNFTPSWQNNNIFWLKYSALNTHFDKVVVSGVTNICSAPQRAKQCRGPLLSWESLSNKQKVCVCV